MMVPIRGPMKQLLFLRKKSKSLKKWNLYESTDYSYML